MRKVEVGRYSADTPNNPRQGQGEVEENARRHWVGFYELKMESGKWKIIVISGSQFGKNF